MAFHDSSKKCGYIIWTILGLIIALYTIISLLYVVYCDIRKITIIIIDNKCCYLYHDNIHYFDVI